MSDRTDTFPAANAPGPGGSPAHTATLFGPAAAPAEGPAVGQASAQDLVHIAQGLYFIFWGVLISLVIGVQIVATLWLRTFAELFLAAGVLATLVGSWRLTQAHLAGLRPAAIGALWRRRARGVFWLAMLLAYFCVLFFMWRRAVENVYLQINALAFVAVGIWYLIILSRTVAVLAVSLGHSEFTLESRLFNASNVGLLLLPFLGALTYVGVMAVRRHSDLLVEFNILLGQLNVVTALIFLLPLSLTLAMVWAAKDIALRRLAETGAAS